jgi:hypothetical protein
MPEHFTRNTLECTAYCRKCSAFTQHRVDGGRRGPCLACIARLEKQNAIDAAKKNFAAAIAEERRQQNPTFDFSAGGEKPAG